MRALLVIVIVIVAGACRGGPCGQFEAWRTVRAPDGPIADGRFVRSCTEDGSGSWNADDTVTLELGLRPRTAEQTDRWILRVTMAESAVREGKRIEAGAALWGDVSRQTDLSVMGLTGGSVEILGIGTPGDPCLPGATLPIQARYDLSFGDERSEDGPGGLATGRDRFRVALGDWACP